MSNSIARHRRSGRAAIIAVSVLGHGLVLAILGLSAPPLKEVRRIDPRSAELEVWPRHRDPLPTRANPGPTAGPSPVRLRRAVLLAPPADTTPLSAVPPVGEPPATGVGAPAAPQAGSGPDGLRQALRGSPVGCANREAVGLTRREREACDEAFGRARDQAVIIDSPMDPAKRAAWDAVAARKAMIRKRKEGAVPPGIATNDNAGGTRTNGIGIGILGY